MSIVCVFSGLYCEAEDILKIVQDETGVRIVTDSEIVSSAAELSGITEDRVVKAFSAGASVFNKFSHEKERAVSWLRLAVARLLSREENFILHGFISQLPPDSISHILRTCLIAGHKHRLEVAKQTFRIPTWQAQKDIRKSDKDQKEWVDMVRQGKDPWAQNLYDLVAPVDKDGVEGAAKLLLTHLANAAIQQSAASERAVIDFLLAAEIETELASAGHQVSVGALNGKATITINRNVLMLERLERELKDIASRVKGVQEVETRVGPKFHHTDIYRKIDFKLPSKVLLVDDEREFVQTLSERLMLRDMGSAVAYDGESALTIVTEDDPEVIVLDLKMPGIDGIEVLRRVKRMRPSIEVIILTGHGTEKDRDICMHLGAFAYLHKPVDIETLSKTIREAHARARAIEA